MENYSQYTSEDFISDDRFVQWVKFPTNDLQVFWSKFIAEHPEKLNEVNEAIEFLRLFEDQSPELPKDKLFALNQQIKERIDIPISASTVHQIVRSRSRKIRMYSLAAAVVIGLVAFVSWWMISPPATQDSVQTLTSKQDYSTNHLKEHVIPKGARSRITLEDGTQAWINAGSKLEYSQDFMAGATRDVYLEGEAYFDVTSDKEHPFIVHIQGVEIRVLGTSFNVKGYLNESKIEATLVHGKIFIAGDSSRDKVTLAPNQRAVFLKKKKKLLVENNVETKAYTSWREGVLVFNDQPLYEIIPILERWFNVNIHTDDAYDLNCRFTAEINNKSLNEVLELFRTSDTIGYDIVANNVYIKGNFCTN